MLILEFDEFGKLLFSFTYDEFEKHGKFILRYFLQDSVCF
jgi:hypothetical protein